MASSTRSLHPSWHPLRVPGLAEECDEGEGGGTGSQQVVPAAGGAALLPAEPAPRASGSGVLAALIENRAKEVGVALLERTSVSLRLMQIIEPSRTYTHTMALLAAADPEQVLVVASAQAAAASGLNRALRCSGTPYSQVPLQRAYFDDTKGLALLRQYAADGCDSLLHRAGSGRSTPYLALGAAGALLRYLEEEERQVLVRGCLRVELSTPDAYLQMDAATADALEVLHQARLGDTVPRAQEARGSGTPTTLLKLLDHTRTAPGARLLRATLLQPPAHLGTIELRQAAIAELLANDDMASELRAALGALPKDLDRVCASLFCRPTGGGGGPAGATRRVSSLIGACILLKEALAALPGLADALAPADSQLLAGCRAAFAHGAWAQLAAEVDAVLDEEAQSSKSLFIARTQQCFALRAGADGLLDVARTNFCRATEQVHALADEYRQQGLTLKVQYSARSGFFLQLPRPGAAPRGGGPPAPPLPQGFIPLEGASGGRGGGRGGGGGAVRATTAELGALNARLRDAMADCMLLTQQVLEDLVARVSGHAPALQRLIDAVALADMLGALALTAALAEEPWVAPRVSEHGPIAIVGGRHPVLERLLSGPYTPNDTYLAPCAALHVITGPNMAGKTTYMKQVALITLLAHTGCHVPATFASIGLRRRLLTRLGSGDALAAGASSFSAEMGDTAALLEAADERSLVIIDELGRATSTTDGLAIAWATAEALAARGVPTLFATHFPELARLAAMYPHIRHWDFEVGTGPLDNRLDFTWRLRAPPARADGSAGDPAVPHYGLLLARSLGFPPKVMETAAAVVQRLEAQQAQRGAARRTGAGGGAPHAAAVARAAELGELAHKVFCLALSAPLQQQHGLCEDGGSDGGRDTGGGTCPERGAGSREAVMKTLRRLKRGAAALAGSGGGGVSAVSGLSSESTASLSAATALVQR